MPLPLKTKMFQERNSENNNVLPPKPLVILAKPPDKVKVDNQIANTACSPTSQNELKPPTLLQKSRDGTDNDGSRAASPGIASPANLSQTASPSTKESETFTDFVKNVSHRVFHIQQKPPASSAEGDQKTLPPPEMTAPVKLIDDTQQWCDSGLEYLHDGNDFYVIGVVGLQGTGKSTILSTIAGSPVFKVQNASLKGMGEHCTSGIDMFVTNQRLILLDTQPLLSPSFMDQMIQYDKKKFFEEKKSLNSSDYYSTESSLYIQSMQQVVFLMSVCHTIISVQDWFIDLNYIRFLLSCEMLKPPKPLYHELKSSHDGATEYYPNLVFVQNKCHHHEFSELSFTQMQKTLYLLFQSSNSNFFGSISFRSSHELYDVEDMNVNLILLPIKEKEDSNRSDDGDYTFQYKGHANFEVTAKSLRPQILSMPRQIMTHTAASEKNWFHYSARIWDTIKKINIFDEYRRHIASVP